MKRIYMAFMQKLVDSRRFLLLPLLFFCCTVSDLQANDGVAARVNGAPLTERQLKGVRNEIISGGVYHSVLSPEKEKMLRSQALDELIKRELYYQEFRRMGKEVDSEALKAAMTRTRSRFRSDKDYVDTLQNMGYTPETLQKEIEKNLIVADFVNTEIIRKSVPTEEMLLAYYEQNKKDFLRPETVKVLHILIKVDPSASTEEKEKQEKLAQDVLARAQAGEDFSALAEKYSMDDWRVKGGDLGAVHRGRLEEELETVVFSLDAGQLTGIVRTRVGYHIARVYEKIPPTQLGFEDVRDRLRKSLEERRRKEIEENLLKALKDKAKIEIY
ncbi:MAG: peptidylprolyl isomerase [Nitrospirae bacterium]|nr:peptidylprolyl isomerase [Nitrospirota bacterium]